MKPLLFALLLVATGLTAALAFPDRAPAAPAAPCGAGRPRDDARACKPQAPIEVRLEQVAADAGRIELAFTVRPLDDLDGLHWELLLPPGVVLMEGVRRGEALGAREALTEGRAVVLLPQDGAAHRVRLAARGVLRGMDETGAALPEPVEVVRSLTWGTVAPAAAEVSTRDGRTGAPLSVVALPVAHRPGR